MLKIFYSRAAFHARGCKLSNWTIVTVVLDFVQPTHRPTRHSNSAPEALLDLNERREKKRPDVQLSEFPKPGLADRKSSMRCNNVVAIWARASSATRRRRLFGVYN